MRSALLLASLAFTPLALALLPGAAADGCTASLACSDSNLPGAGCQATWVQDPSGSVWIGEASCPASPAGGGTFTCWYVDTIGGWIPVACTA
jgi:hypothetical protein